MAVQVHQGQFLLTGMKALVISVYNKYSVAQFEGVAQIK